MRCCGACLAASLARTDEEDDAELLLGFGDCSSEVQVEEEFEQLQLRARTLSTMRRRVPTPPDGASRARHLVAAVESARSRAALAMGRVAACAQRPLRGTRGRRCEWKRFLT